MKQTIEIEVPEGKKAVWKEDKIVFEDIKSQLPKTWKEFCNTHPIVNTEYFIGNNSTVHIELPKPEIIRIRDSYYNRHLLESEDDVVAHVALIQLHRLRDCYRQGWTPYWNSLQNKWFIHHIYSANGEDYYSVENIVNRVEFLSFQSEEIATEFLNNFRDLIKLAGDLI